MAKSIALAPDAYRLASLLLSYIPAVCAFVAPRQPGAGAAIIDRLFISFAAAKGHLSAPKGPRMNSPTTPADPLAASDGLVAALLSQLL
jgi:hypothetical protein